jgi:uncharacterized membrane protein YqaE (UPF0057 family)
MKTKKILTANLFLVLAVVLASCGTSVEIAKRTFNDGYYVHVSKSKHVAVKNEIAQASPENISKPVLKEENSINSLAVNKNESCADIVSEKTNNTIDNSTVASVGKKPVLSAKKNFPFSEGTETCTPVAEANSMKSDKMDFEFKKQFVSVKETRNFIRHHLFKTSNTPTIVLILLCLFLPFIAVGIVDNWGTRFLISILLCLLFWIPGVIYAFIVCFG